MACLKKRGSQFYAQYYVAGKQKRVSLDTDSYQLAKEKIRQLESSLAQGAGSPFPTRTPIAQVLTDFVLYISASRSPRSVRSNVYYLREAFGPVCPAVTVTSRRTTEKARKRALVPQKGRPRTVPPMEANSFEEITTTNERHAAEFVGFRTLSECDVSRFIKPSHNTIRFSLTNARNSKGAPLTNPMGFCYRLEVEYQYFPTA